MKTASLMALALLGIFGACVAAAPVSQLQTSMPPAQIATLSTALLPDPPKQLVKRNPVDEDLRRSLNI